MQGQTTCSHGHSAPTAVIVDLDDGQALTAGTRHKCVVCAYSHGHATGRAGVDAPADAVQCKHGSWAPVDLGTHLGPGQGGPGRHKCAVCAYHLGYRQGLQIGGRGAGRNPARNRGDAGGTGAEAGLSREEQIRLALCALEANGGAATIDQIYRAVEAQMGGLILSEQGRASLREFVNRVAVQKGFVQPFDERDPLWRITPAGRQLIGNETGPSALAPVIQAQEQALDAAGVFDPTSITDARQRAMAAVVLRRGRPAFRDALIQAYGGRCAVTGADVVAALEAAHIIRFQGPKTDDPANGLLLRADIHTLFDLRLIAVDTSTMTVLTAPSLAGTCYGQLCGTAMRLPSGGASAPSKAALDAHRKEAGL